ncbi:MAG: hypothetical protein DIU78_012220, partial [Pseudomonadota bacterium]
MTQGVWGDDAIEWVLAHGELERLAKERAELDGREGVALLRAYRAGVHRHLGYASFAQYVENLFGYSFRTTDDKLRTAMALEELPELGKALNEGTLCWSAVRELVRVATPATEHEWLEVARGKTVRRIEQLVSGKAPGDKPSDPGRPEVRRHVLRFDVSAQTYATFREAAALLRRRCSEPMNDDMLLLHVAREILGGPSDAGRSSYQVSVTVCERCQRGIQHAAGADVELPPEVVDMILCDAQVIGCVPSRDLAAENDDDSDHSTVLDHEQPAASAVQRAHVGEVHAQPGAAHAQPEGAQAQPGAAHAQAERAHGQPGAAHAQPEGAQAQPGA